MSASKRNNEEAGTNSAGQSGDNQQISNNADSNSESVEELLEEGNSFEADAVQGVEDANDPDVSEVITRQVPEDDVPPEYLDEDDEKIA
jgi:N utilization substance protein A